MTKNDIVYKAVNDALTDVNKWLATEIQDRDIRQQQLNQQNEYIEKLSDTYDKLKEWIDEYDSDS